MKTAIYARVSTQDQTCESQLRELREYAARRGWSIACEYVDTGLEWREGQQARTGSADAGCHPAQIRLCAGLEN